MDARVPGTVRAVVAAAQRRALLASIAGKALAAWPFGAGVGLACVVIDRVAPTGLGWPVLALGPVAAAGLGACVWAWVTRPGSARVARRLDDALRLKSRVASSLELAGPGAEADAGMVRLLSAQAEEVARTIDPRRVFPVRVGRVWPLGPALAALACAAGVWLPPGPWRQGAVSPADGASAPAGADLPALRTELAEARELLRPGRVVGDDAPARAQAEETLARVEQELAEGKADATRARTAAAQALDLAAMEAEARAKRRDEQADAALQRLAQLREAGERAGAGARGSGGAAGGAPGGALSDSLREGDLATAAETLRRAIEELERLPPEARARLADELAQLARDLDAIEGAPGKIEPPAAASGETTGGNAAPGAPASAPPGAPSGQPSSAPVGPGPGATRPDRPAMDAARRALSEAGASPEQADRALGAESPESLRDPLESAGVEPERAAELAEGVKREREREAAREAAREQTRRLAESAREAAEALREPPSAAPAQDPAAARPQTNPPGSPGSPDAGKAPAGEPRRPGATEPPTPQASPATGPGSKTDKPEGGSEPRDAGKPGGQRDAGKSGESSKPGGQRDAGKSGESNPGKQEPGAQPSRKPGESPAATGGSPPTAKPEEWPSPSGEPRPGKPEGGQSGSQPGGKPAEVPGSRPDGEPVSRPGDPPGARPAPGSGKDVGAQPQSQTPASGAAPGAQRAPSPDRQGQSQAKPGAPPRSPAGGGGGGGGEAGDKQAPSAESPPPAGGPASDRAPATGTQSRTPSPQGSGSSREKRDADGGEGSMRQGAGPEGASPDLPELPKDQRSLERLAKQIGEMAEQRRRAGEDRKDAEALREMAQRWWDKASPDQRQQAERLARELARQRGANAPDGREGAGDQPPSANGRDRDGGGAGAQPSLAARGGRTNTPGLEGQSADQSEASGRAPGSPAQRTHVVDARSKGDDAPAPAARDRVMAQWLTNRPAAGGSAPGDAAEARGILREAARAAQQAVDDRTLPRRYDRLLKRYFQHAPEELGLIPPAAPPPAPTTSPSPPPPAPPPPPASGQ